MRVLKLYVECGLLRQTILLLDPRGKRCVPDVSAAWPRDIKNLMANYAPPSAGVYFGGQKIGTVTNLSTLGNGSIGAGSGRINLPKKNNKILFQTLDLRVSHKTKVFPSQIVVKGGKFITPGPGGNKNGYYAVDSATNRPYFFTHYEISRYYFGKSYKKISIKGNRIILPAFEITSNSIVKLTDVKFKKYDILNRTKERMIAAMELEEKKSYDRAIKAGFKNPPAEEGWLDISEGEE